MEPQWTLSCKQCLVSGASVWLYLFPRRKSLNKESFGCAGGAQNKQAMGKQIRIKKSEKVCVYKFSVFLWLWQQSQLYYFGCALMGRWPSERWSVTPGQEHCGVGVHSGHLCTLLQSPSSIFWLALQFLPLKDISTAWCCHHPSRHWHLAFTPKGSNLSLQTREFSFSWSDSPSGDNSRWASMCLLLKSWAAMPGSGWGLIVRKIIVIDKYIVYI